MTILSQPCATLCANYVLSLPPWLLSPLTEAISIRQTLELLGLYRRGVATKAWGLLGPTQLLCSLEEPHKHGAEHKPVGTQLPHAEKGRIQEAIPPICQDRGEQTEMCQDMTAHALYGRASTVYIMQNRPQVFVPHPMQFLLAYINHKVKSDAYLEPTPPGARSSEGTRWLMGEGWSSEPQHGPPRQSIGQVTLTSPTRQALGHHKIAPPLCPVSAQPSTAHRSSKPARVWPQTVAKGPGVC